MTELTGLLWLVAGLAGLGVTGALIACSLRIASTMEFVLATYVVAWGWLVVLTLLLSPPGLVTRGWLTLGIAVGLVAALLVWHGRGRPPPPRFRPALAVVRDALRLPVLLVLALAVALGAVYSLVLALFVPVNDGDALAYHLARAAFWKQEQQVGYIAHAVDLRLDVNPPNAEIGQLATMLLSGSDRYVALPQLIAYAALVLCVAALARRIGLTVPEALFGALVFATLPIVLVQASSALNDLVVASLLAAACVFTLRPGRISLVLVALAVGLAIGTKFTAPLALPGLALVAVFGRQRRDWPGLGLAGLAGLALGCIWYVVNLTETGDLDGGLAASADQRVDHALPAVTIEWLRLLLDLLDLSGTPRPHYYVYTALGVLLATIGVVFVRRSLRTASAFALAGAAVAAAPTVIRSVFGGVQDIVFRTWVVLERPETAAFEYGWGLNFAADPVVSWYGPLGVCLLVLGAIVVTRMATTRRLPSIAVALALMPLVLLTTLALALVWDPYRGRFFVVGFALAAATWGLLARSRIAAGAVAALGVTSLAFSLANHYGKPSGFGELWSVQPAPLLSTDSIWRDSRTEAQARVRPGSTELGLFRRFEAAVPSNASVAIAPHENDFLSPYFGPRFSRHVELLGSGDARPPPRAEWLLVGPRRVVRRCPDSWEETFEYRGWILAHRAGPDVCADPTPF